DMDYPAYISPDTGPLEVSMLKQDKLQKQIEELMAQSVETIKSSSNGDSTSGLKAIGDELEYGENVLAHFWALYEGSDNPANVTYPDSYEIKTDKDRLEDSEKLLDLAER